VESARAPRSAGLRDEAGQSREVALPRWLRTAGAYAWAFVGLALAAVALAYALARLRVVVVPVIAAFFVTALLSSPARWLRRRGLPGWASSLAALGLALLALAGAIVFVEQRVAFQFGAVDFSVQRGLEQIERVLVGLPFISPAQIAEAAAAVKDQFLSTPRPPGGERTSALLSGALTGITVLAEAALAVFVSFFFLLEGERLWRACLGLWAPESRADADAIGRRAWGTLQAYLSGIALVALFNTVLTGIALYAIGVPLVRSLMILMFLATFFPLVGSYVAGSVAALVALVFGGVSDALLVLGAVVVIQQLEGNLFYPLVVGRRVQLHPVVIVLALAAGGTLAGVLGAFVAVPLAAVIGAAGGHLLTSSAAEVDLGSPQREEAEAEPVGRALSSAGD